VRLAASYKRHRRLYITFIGAFPIRGTCAIEVVVTWTYPQERGPGAKDLVHGTIGEFSMTSLRSEAAIDEIVASCNGDLRGAVKALLLVNEQLEAELQQLYAAVTHGPFERGSNLLH
jgi:hypothetical protein